MNKQLKIIISILGGINTIVSVFIPTLVALLIIDMVVLTQLNQLVLMIAALLSTFYRGVSTLIPILINENG